MLGTLASGQLFLEELHRFPNLPVRVQNSLRWDLLGLFREIKIGLKKAADRGIPIASVSVDTWGVDYVWVGRREPALTLPRTYRDERHDGAFTEALALVSREKIFAETGLQFMPFNTLYQLFADHRDSPEVVAAAACFLPMADFFHFLLCHRMVCEESLASTSQIFDPRSKTWSTELQQAFGLRPEVFPPLVPSGTKLGPLTQEVAAETNLPGVEVVATCSHDTGAAVAAVPATEGEDWAFLSSGTWSLIGVELPAPLLSDEVRAANFTNEGGYGGSIRFLKNVVGLWILQECRRSWEAAGRSFTYEEITNLAAEAEPLRMLINPADERFLKPGGMPEKIASFCEETAQPIPATPGQTARCILESLALTYRVHLANLEKLTGRDIRRLHIVGGGSKSALLNQMAANATGREVLAGPNEATAVGNVLIQALAMGHLADLNALRQTVRNSFPIANFSPKDGPLWAEAAERFAKLGAIAN
jgi:rhamnulokinase